ncbi:hypothetical protein Y032_0117g648 [Ancylostoma ceylanicum]|uniref:Uncharacterized protein n=1 Tax=Ancylostoma ceylanicum TaxID=53326 RepID=A0A016TBU9_9BILA|nr:hypothetical protein Y032_0117g648 [Ancylostoma ceylanicum]
MPSNYPGTSNLLRSVFGPMLITKCISFGSASIGQVAPSPPIPYSSQKMSLPSEDLTAPSTYKRSADGPTRYAYVRDLQEIIYVDNMCNHRLKRLQYLTASPIASPPLQEYSCVRPLTVPTGFPYL